MCSVTPCGSIFLPLSWLFISRARLEVKVLQSGGCAGYAQPIHTQFPPASIPPLEGRSPREEALLSPFLAYCFFASNWLVVPCSVSVTATVRVLPSGDTVFLAMPITFPSRLSVSSKEFLPVRLTDTLVVPGSPL